MKSDTSGRLVPVGRADMARAGLVRALLLAGAAMLPVGARAQSMDYGALEQVFGEPVTTAATGSPQRASLAPANIVIITQDDIRRSGADNIPDILATIPGLDVRRASLSGADVGIRGYNQQSNPRTLVLLNGRPVYDDFYGAVFWNGFPVQLDEIRQIEVVKGPASALFGFNAATGVVNIVTFNPLYDKVTAVSVRSGTQSLVGASAVGTVNQPGVWGLRLSAGGMRANDFTPPASTTENIHPTVGTLNGLGTYKLPDGLEITLEAGLSKNDTWSDGASPLGFDIRGNDVRVAASDATVIGQTNVQFYRNETHEEVLVGSDETNDVYDLQARDLLKLGTDHVVRINLEWKDNSAYSRSFFHGTAGYNDYAASLMWNWQVVDTVSVTNAIRVDRLGLNYTGAGLPAFGITQSIIDSTSLTGYSFNSGVVWQVTPDDTLRLTAGRGLQLPSLFGFAANLDVAPHTYDIGTPALLPTAVTSIELGYDRGIAALLSTLHASVFAERNDDLIAGGLGGVPVVSPVGFALSAANVGHSDTLGFEIGLKGAAPFGLTWNVWWASQAITDHIHNNAPDNQQTDYTSSTPHNVYFAGLGYHHDKLEVDANIRWQSTYQDFGGPNVLSPRMFLIDNFYTLNGRIAYEVYPHTTLAVSAAQLLNSQVIETLGPPVDRRVIVSLSYKL